jgi:broad specificity phosphatase PhoE
VGQTRIVLVRHGESLAQERRVVGGHGCAGLSELGKRQVTALRDRLLDTGELADATVLYSSLMARAVQTAEILAPALGDLEIRQDCGFCEGHPVAGGDGMSWEEYDRRWPEPAEWTPESRRGPGGETYAEMRGRITARVGALAREHPGQTVVVACHGGVVLHTLFEWLRLDPAGDSGRAWLDPVNSSLTEWRMAENPFSGKGLPIQLVRFNDHAHLRGDLLPRRRDAA